MASWPYGLPLVSHPTMPWHLSSLTLAVFCWPGAGERAIAYVAMKRAALGHALRLAKAPRLPLASGSGRRPTGLVNVLFANASCSGLAVVVAFRPYKRQYRTSSWLTVCPCHPPACPGHHVCPRSSSTRLALSPRCSLPCPAWHLTPSGWCMRLRLTHALVWRSRLRVRAVGRPTGEE